jgi:hypothetical protein
MGKINVRMSDDLQTKLAKEAAKANRSLNGEIIHRLAESLKKPLPTAPSVGLRREDVIAIVKEFARGNDS